MLGVLQNVGGASGFDHLTAEHDDDAIGQSGKDMEVMCDEQNGHAMFFLQPGQQLDDLFLHGGVESGGGFIGDEQGGTGGEGHGDHDTLLHAAG